MFIKQIITAILLCKFACLAQGQIHDNYDLNKSVGKLRTHLETGNYLYRNAEKNNYYKFGYGFGAESLFPQNEVSNFSVAFGLLYNGVHEERKTYSVENASYYYRSTTLTGRFVGNTSLFYKRNLGKQFQAGFGFQVNVVLKEFKDQYILGESISPIPDISFQRTEFSFLTSVGYVIDSNWMVNFIGQFAVDPVTQSENSTYVRAFRMQLSRRIK